MKKANLENEYSSCMIDAETIKLVDNVTSKAECVNGLRYYCNIFE